MDRWKLLVGVAVVCLGLGLPRVQAAATSVDLSGTWKINKDLSDKPPSADDRQGREGERGRGGSWGRGGRAGGGGGAGGGLMGGGLMGGGRRPDPEEMRRIRGQVGEAAQLDERLVIVQNAEGVSITTGDGRFVKLIPDGKSHESLTGDGELKTKTKWDGDRLVSDGKLKDGIEVTRTYSLDTTVTPRRLVLLVKIESPGGRGGRELKRVYDLDTGEH